MPRQYRKKPHNRLAALLVASILVSQPSLIYANEPQPITLNSTTLAPLSTKDQKGFIDLVVIAALSRIGIKLNTVHLPAERALLDSNNGLLDGEISRVAGLESTYSNLIPIDEKLMDLEFTVFSKSVRKLDSGWDGLAKYSIAILNGWKILEQNIPEGTELTKVQSSSQLFNLLNHGRVDLIIYERWSGIGITQKMGFTAIKPLSPPVAVRSMHIYLHKKHSKLVKQLETALRDIKSDGTYDRIYTQILQPMVDQ